MFWHWTASEPEAKRGEATGQHLQFHRRDTDLSLSPAFQELINDQDTAHHAVCPLPSLCILAQSLPPHRIGPLVISLEKLVLPLQGFTHLKTSVLILLWTCMNSLAQETLPSLWAAAILWFEHYRVTAAACHRSLVDPWPTIPWQAHCTWGLAQLTSPCPKKYLWCPRQTWGIALATTWIHCKSSVSSCTVAVASSACSKELISSFQSPFQGPSFWI